MNKHRALAGIKGYETDLVNLPANEVIGHYRRLFNIEKSFRMWKSDLKARPIYARKQDSVTAHLNIGGETIHAAVPLPPEIQTLVNTITAPTLRH
ncbi:hypothetical protein HMPREF2974_02565 [Corynebacterium sp. HMSC078C09]|nr:hypothetical protein HMPREF2974_02565 [Corynebacterium sp. HMSC078C09]